MRNKSVFVTSAFVTFCIITNYFGKLTCEHFQLPFWFDSFGTVLTAYVLGPICGAIVGASCNLIYGIVYSKFYYAYGIVSIMNQATTTWVMPDYMQDRDTQPYVCI